MQQADFASGTVIKLMIPVSVQICTHETELWECNYLKKVSLRVQREQSDWNHDLIYSLILHKKNQTFENRGVLLWSTQSSINGPSEMDVRKDGLNNIKSITSDDLRWGGVRLIFSEARSKAILNT